MKIVVISEQTRQRMLSEDPLLNKLKDIEKKKKDDESKNKNNNNNNVIVKPNNNNDKVDTNDKADKNNNNGNNVIVKPNNNDKVDKTDKVDTNDKVDKTDKVDTNDKVDKTDKVDTKSKYVQVDQKMLDAKLKADKDKKIQDKLKADQKRHSDAKAKDKLLSTHIPVVSKTELGSTVRPVKPGSARDKMIAKNEIRHGSDSIVNKRKMNADFQSMKAGNISKADFIKQYPNSQTAKKFKMKALESYEPYDLVLDYVLSEGHADNIEEAHYVMMQMDEETIQTITEIKKRLFGAALLATPFVMQKIKDKFDPIGNERKKYQDALKKKYEKQSGTEGQGYFN